MAAVLSLYKIVSLLVAVGVLVALSKMGNRQDQSAPPERRQAKYVDRQAKCVDRKAYLVSCLKLYNELRNPNPTMVYRPPLREIPVELFEEFTQHGDMPLAELVYFNDVYNDSNSIDKNEIFGKIAEKEVNDFVQRLETVDVYPAYGIYGDIYTYPTMNKFRGSLRGKSLVVVGTMFPWVEAIGVKLGMSKITSLDYTRKQYENDRGGQLSWRHVFDYFDESLASKQIEQFENAASYSSIEHSGLGRYGDPLDPIGDVKAVKQTHCMIKPGGLFFLGLPMTGDNTSALYYNAHRYYGPKRMALILGESDWDLLEVSPISVVHQVHVLRKRDNFC